MDRLRSPGGCPWDAEQTHASLAPYAIEEAHELAEAAESGDLEHLREELGDLLLQVLFHARIAQERDGGFDVQDVAQGLVDKLTVRHPHVFSGDGEAGLDADEVNRRWDQIKATQQTRESVLDGIPPSLPALARAQKVLRRIERSELDASITEASNAVEQGASTQDASITEASNAVGQEIGARLLQVVRDAAAEGIDAEAALREQVRSIEQTTRAAEARRALS